MIKKIVCWFLGYVYVRLKGYSPERFLNICSSHKIFLWNISHEEGKYCFCISLKNYKNIKRIAKKSKTVPYIIKRYGFPFYIHRYRKRIGFFAGSLFCAILIYMMSLYIWNITVEGGYKYTQSTILQYLDTIDVYSGMKKAVVDGRAIEEKLRINYPDIGWVSAEVKGTRLLIKIEETIIPKAAKEIREPSHIVAKKNGIVTSMIVRTGTPKVKIGDIVKKGDILVSGVIDVIGDNETMVNRYSVVADADIALKTYYEYEDKIARNYKQKVYTKHIKNGFVFKLFDKKIISYNPRYSYVYYDIIKDNMFFRITDSFFLPIELTRVRVNEYYEVERYYSESEILDVTERKLLRYLDYLSSNGVEILENNVKFDIDNKKCIAKGKLIVNETAWSYKKIDESEWRFEEIDELN